MKKTRIAIFVLSLVVAGVVYAFVKGNNKGIDQLFLLPMGFRGCVVILYDIENSPPLVLENNEIVYEVPSDGIIKTSSPMEFGWVNEKRSGAYAIRAFYVDDSGRKVEELSEEMIRFGTNGAIQRDGQRQQRYYYQLFGPIDVENEGCKKLKYL